MRTLHIQAAAIVLAVCAVVMAFCLLLDPFGLKARQKAKAKQWEGRARQEELLRRNQGRAQAQITATQGHFQERAADLGRLTEAAVQQAREEEDAKSDLGTERRRRLGEHDNSLCVRAPELGGCRG